MTQDRKGGGVNKVHPLEYLDLTRKCILTLVDKSGMAPSTLHVYLHAFTKTCTFH